MPTRLRWSLAASTGVVFLIPALALYGEFTKRSDIWWTPRTLLVPLSEAAGRVEVYVRGQPLAAVLEAGQLRIADGAPVRALAATDVGFRFNNWDRVRVQRLPLLLGYAAVSAVGAVLFLLLVTGRLAYRGEIGPVAA